MGYGLQRPRTAPALITSPAARHVQPGGRVRPTTEAPAPYAEPPPVGHQHQRTPGRPAGQFVGRIAADRPAAYTLCARSRRGRPAPAFTSRPSVAFRASAGRRQSLSILRRGALIHQGAVGCARTPAEVRYLLGLSGVPLCRWWSTTQPSSAVRGSGPARRGSAPRFLPPAHEDTVRVARGREAAFRSTQLSTSWQARAATHPVVAGYGPHELTGRYIVPVPGVAAGDGGRPAPPGHGPDGARDGAMGAERGE